MANANKIGIWLDHSHAHLIEYTTDPIETTTLASDFTHEVREESMKKSENVAHNKEQHDQAHYYKQLGDIIKNYSSVILFGPTEAKVELYNLIKKDTHFEKIDIKVHNSDKMTENQQHAFVRAYFSDRHL